MEQQISFPKKQEHDVNIENVSIRMLTYRVREGKPIPGNRYPLHTHAHAELFACSEGTFHLRTAGSIVTVSAGDIVIVPAGFPHHKLPSTGDTVWHCLDFICAGRRRASGTDLAKRLGALCNTDCLLIARNVPALCREIAMATTNNEEELPCLSALRLATVLTDLSSRTLQRVGREEAPSHASPAGEEITDINRLFRLDHLINTRYMNSELSVARAAELLYISERQLERIMQKEYGMPFRRTLCARRLDAAEQMLREEALSIEQIASAVGFSGQSAFCRAFLQKHGITPTQYRAAKNI